MIGHIVGSVGEGGGGGGGGGGEQGGGGGGGGEQQQGEEMEADEGGEGNGQGEAEEEDESGGGGGDSGQNQNQNKGKNKQNNQNQNNQNNGGKGKGKNKGNNNNNNKKQIKLKPAEIAANFVDFRRKYDWYQKKFVFYEALNIASVLLSLFITDFILHGKFWDYGYRVIGYLNIYGQPRPKDQNLHNPMCEVFPTEVRKMVSDFVSL